MNKTTSKTWPEGIRLEFLSPRWETVTDFGEGVPADQLLEALSSEKKPQESSDPRSPSGEEQE